MLPEKNLCDSPTKKSDSITTFQYRQLHAKQHMEHKYK